MYINRAVPITVSHKITQAKNVHRCIFLNLNTPEKANLTIKSISLYEEAGYLIAD